MSHVDSVAEYEALLPARSRIGNKQRLPWSEATALMIVRIKVATAEASNSAKSYCHSVADRRWPMGVLLKPRSTLAGPTSAVNYGV